MIASFLVVIPPGSAAGAMPMPSGTAPASASVWDIQQTPNGHARTAGFSAVSCTKSIACTAVGDYVTTSGASVTLAERWNGTGWAFQPTANPPGAGNSNLGAVSCTTATACTAVGSYTGGSSSAQELPLAEEWNGTGWALQPTANPAGATSSFLDAVSCTTATACTAVGRYETSSNQVLPLAEQWNGTSWALQPTANPAGATSSFLDAVSCTMATACTAVGQYYTSSRQRLTLAEAWNGTAWTIQPTPNPPGAANSRLNAVSCTTPTACTAVGQYVSGTNQTLTLAEAWNGTAWTIQPAPNPAGTTNSRLNAVSCTTPTACTAVGQ